MKKIIFGILALAVGLISFFSFKTESSAEPENELNYKILQKWDLPDILSEVSGIAWIGENRMVCVQDEDGIIFIYNLQTSQIEERINFGNGGDYEGIAVIENDAFVMRSDGIIFEVSNFEGGDPKVTRHVTQLNRMPEINFEGFCADPANNRLLLAVKERKDFNKHKEVYAFDLDKKMSADKPLFMVDLSGPIFNRVDEKLKEKFSPGEMNIHPQTGEYFILDGSRPKLLITDKKGRPEELVMLRIEDFENPEGLTFSPEGDLYISNEAEDGPANILRISLDRKSN